MKLVLIVFVASIASTFAAERGLQSLAKQWNITDPTFTYSALGFDLDYQVSDFISDAMAAYSLYTSPGCKEDGVGVPSTVLTSSQDPLGGDVYNAGNNGDGVRDAKVKVAVVASEIAGSAIYSEDTTVGDVSAEINFCVRFSLQTDPGTVPGSAIEVNFLETLVTLFVDLSDGFEIGEVQVAPKDKLLNTANQVYTLTGYQCSPTNVELTGEAISASRNQGSVIRVCVTPDPEALTAGIKMRSLDVFVFTRGSLAQPAVLNNQASNNGLTSLSCNSGVEVCSFETILFAAFYSTAGAVAGSGTGSMQFGNARRLRALQAGAPEAEAAATSDFDLDFGVNPVAERQTSSDAATSGVMAATALVMAGAFIALM